MKTTFKVAASIGAALGLAVAGASVLAHPGGWGGMYGTGPGHMMGGWQGGCYGGGPGGMYGGMWRGYGGPGAEGSAQPLVTPEERQAWHEQMHSATTPEERQAIAEAHHAEIQRRAAERGITLPEPRGHGRGRGYGPGGRVTPPEKPAN